MSTPTFSWRSAKHALAIMLGVSLSLAGCAGRDVGIELRRPGNVPGNGIATDDTHRGAPYSYGALPLCLSTPGKAVIQQVTAKGGRGGTRITAFATRPFPRLGDPVTEGAIRGTLREMRFTPAAVAEVATVCPKPDAAVTDASKVYTELGVEVERTSAATGSLEAIEVTYTVTGDDGKPSKPKTFDIWFEVTLCAENDHSPPDCGAPAPSKPTPRKT